MRTITVLRAEHTPLARLSGVNIETIRYYERIKMLPARQRTAALSRRHSGQSAIATLLTLRRGSYALPEIFLRNFPVRIRCSRSILTRSRVLSLIAPVANISFIGVQ